MFKRKCQVLCVALLGLCSMNGAWGLGLGEIDVQSALNERFEGTIELLDARGLQANEVVINMAASEHFERIGVERFYYLTTISFEVDLNGPNGPRVLVSSSQPISEPYLDFIVEVRWPSGRLYKEYTVLLDPPTISEIVAAPVEAPAQVTAQAQPQQPAQSRPAPRPRQQRTAPAPRPQAAAPREDLADGLMTTTQDTLWTIANRTRASSDVSINQQMLAIQRLNRDAFVRDNINLLKAGYRLDLPSERQAMEMSRSDADLAVATQAEEWRNPGQRAEQVAATAPDEASTVAATPAPATATAPAPQGGQVRIVANTGSPSGGTSGNNDGEQVNQLLEETAGLNRQVDELNYQLDREKEIAANEISVKERQLEVKNQEIAEMQQTMREMQQQLDAMRENQTQNQNTDPGAETPLWMSPLVLGAIIGVLVLLLVILLIVLRRGRNESSYDEEYVDDDVDLLDDHDDALAVDEYTRSNDSPVEPVVGGAVAGAAVAGAAALEDQEDDAAETLELDVDDLDDFEPIDDDGVEMDEGGDAVPQNQTSDPVGEAEIYIAYGRFGQAVNLLLGALQAEPDRHDVRLKLLEVFTESADQTQFAEHAQYLVDNCQDENILMAVRDLETQISESQLDLEADIVGEQSDAQDSAESPALDEDLELDLDDVQVSDGEVDLELSGEKAGDDGDFELEFDTDDGETSSPQSATEGSLGGDLGMDFDPDRDVSEDTEQPAAPKLEDESDAFDLDALPGDAEDASSQTAAEGDAFDFDASGDPDINETKLDLAEAYVDMGDVEGARDILKEVAEEGTDDQQAKARQMLDDMG